MSISASNKRPAASAPALMTGEDMAPATGLLLALAVAGIPAVLLGIIARKWGVSGNPWVLGLGLITVCANVCVILMDLRYGLAIFILATALSPKLPGAYNNLRVEDFVFVLVFMIWLVKTLRTGRWPALNSPMLLPFGILTLLSIVSTMWGGSIGQVGDLKYSLFLQLKRVEYYLIFCVVASTVRSEAWLRILTLVFVASGGLAALYGLATPQLDTSGVVAQKRVMGPEGENYNTLAGYMVLCIGTGLAVIPGYTRSIPRLLVVAATGLAVAALLGSYSREGYVMLAGCLAVFGFTRQRWILMVAAVALSLAFVLVEPVRNHVALTSQTITNSTTDDAGGNSLTARYSAWKYRYEGWFLKQPILGSGVGSVGLSVDNEYLLRLCEVGIVGFLVFLWWLIAIGKHVIRLQWARGMPRHLALGLGAGFVGLLIQGMAAAAFTTIRTMEPFWYLMGLVAAAVALQQTAEVRRDAGEKPQPGWS